MTLTLTLISIARGATRKREANRKVLYKGNLRKNRKEKKYENEKQNIGHRRDRTTN